MKSSNKSSITTFCIVTPASRMSYFVVEHAC